MEQRREIVSGCPSARLGAIEAGQLCRDLCPQRVHDIDPVSAPPRDPRGRPAFMGSRAPERVWLAKQMNPGPVSELRRLRVPEGTHWNAHLDPAADGGRGVVRLRGWATDQKYGDGNPRVDVTMSPLAALGLSRFLSASGEFEGVRPGVPSVMPRLPGQRRVDVGNGDIEVRWAGAFDGDGSIRLDAVDVASGEVRLALETPPAQAQLLEVMLRVRLATAGVEFSGSPR